MNRLTIRNALLPIVDGSSGTWRGRSHLPATARGLLLACLLAAGAFGAEHHGTVLFGGMPVPGATVTATKDDKRLVAITDDRGAYSFPGLADGIWTIKVEMLCFETIKREVAIQADAPPPTWELKLLPPGQLHTVEQQAAPPPKTATPAEPTAAAPAAAPTDGAKSAKGNGKNAQAAAPAQNGFQRTDLKASADAGSIAAEAPEPGGSNQSSGDAYTVNGSMNNGAASPYAQSAAFGNGRKGPRSMYQAALSVTMDNSALDARTFSLTGQDTPKVAYNQLNGTASFGGPLLIPHVIPPTRQPAFFFLSYQWNRSRNATNSPNLVPTESERSGDFSQAVSRLGVPLTIYDPATGAPFPGNIIPQTRISLSPQAQALLAYYPLPNFASSTYNYQVPTPSTTSQDAVQARLNKALSMKNQFNGNFAWQHNNAGSTNAFGFLDNTHTSSVDVAPNWNHRFSNRVFSTLKFDFSRQDTLLTPYFANRVNVSGNAGIAGNDQDALNWGPPALSFTSSNIATMSDPNNALNRRNQTSWLSSNTFWNHRSHNINFGADYRWQQFNYLSQSNPRGTFGFTGAATEAFSGGLPVANTGMDFADFLLGTPDTIQVAYGNADKYLRSSFDDAYINDDWRVKPGFSINAGLRWEYNAPITELRGRLVNLDVLPGFANYAPVTAYDPVGSLTGRHYADSLLNPDHHEFEPRIGIAWHPFAASPLTIRAGYGLYFNTSIYQSIATQMYQQSPLSRSVTMANPAGPGALTLANGFSASGASDTFGIDPNFKVGYAHNWQLVVQRDLPGGLVGVVTYNGIKGTRAVQLFLPNTYPVGAIDPCPACRAGYYYMDSGGNSTREALILQLRRRLRSGFTASVQYTYSKSIDDAALGGRGTGAASAGQAQTGPVIAQNWLDLSAERGPSAFDQRNLVTALVQYTTGMGVHGGTLSNGWKGEIWKHWTLSSQINAGSGLPETPTYSLTDPGTGVTGPIRPSYTGADVYNAPAGLYLNPAAFTAPAAGQWGTAGRDSIVGPYQFSLNTSMSRTFDEGKLDFSINSTNPINHVTWTGWDVAVTSGQFGLPANANAMRRLQATLRFRF